MKIQGNTIVFEHLRRVDDEVIGNTKELVAATPEAFDSINAPGEFSDCNDINESYNAGIESAKRLQAIFG